MSTVQNGMTAVNINENVQRLDWNPQLADIFLNRNTFFSLVDKVNPRSKTDNRKFSWGEYDEDPISVEPSDGTTTAITVTEAEAKKLLKDDVLYCEELDEYLLVDATPTASGSTDVSVSKVLDDGTGTETLTADRYNNKTLSRVYNMKENASYETNLDKITFFEQVQDQHNYVGIMEDFVKIGKTVAHEKWNFTNYTRRQHLRLVKLQNHIDKIEKMAWVGKQFVNSSGNGRQFSKGFKNFSGIQTLSGSVSNFTYNNFVDDFCRGKVIAKNDKEVLDAFVNPYMLSFLSAMAEDSSFMTFDKDGKKDRYGLNFHYLDTPHVTLRLRKNRALKELYARPVMAVIDIPKLSFRYLNDQNTYMEYDVQPTWGNFYMDKIYSMIGLELHNANQHSWLELSL
jgi:hypothetical protein